MHCLGETTGYALYALSRGDHRDALYALTTGYALYAQCGGDMQSRNARVSWVS